MLRAGDERGFASMASMYAVLYAGAPEGPLPDGFDDGLRETSTS